MITDINPLNHVSAERLGYQTQKPVALAGSYTWPLNDQKFPKVQIITTDELLADKKPDMPAEHGTYMQAPRAVREQDSGEQLSLD